MREQIVPMIHVPDVRATVDWYQDKGFKVVQIYEDGDEGLGFAIVAWGDTWVYFSSGGKASSERRREVDLYVFADDVDALNSSIRDRVEIVEDLHDTFYGNREFIIRDINRFWITFAQVIGNAEN